MAIRLFLVIGLTLLTSLAGTVDARRLTIPDPVTIHALTELTTVVASDTIDAGSFGTERVLCPTGMVAVGGGVDMENVLTMKVTSSAPTFPGGERLITQPDGTRPAPVGWQAAVLNESGTEQRFKVAVICAPLSNVSVVVASDTASGGSFGTERVLCPDATIAVGGGIDMDNVLTMQVTSSAPTFPGGERLITQPDGPRSAPVGWQASALNKAGSRQGFKVAVICAVLPNVQAVVDSDTVGANSFGIERIACPTEAITLGGGVDMDNVLTMQVTSSAPVFSGDRLITRPDGTNPKPDAWQASAYNDNSASQGFKVAVVCALPVNVFLPLVLR